MLTAEQAIDTINSVFGAHAGCRALHAKGVTCRGSFTASPEAAEVSRAAHLQGGTVPVVARLSNGSGDPGEHDAAPGVRGLAVGFELPGGERTDIVAQNQPRFPVSTPEAFMELLTAVDPGPKMVVKLPWFLARHPRAARALVANSSSLKAPAAYGSIPYFAVHIAARIMALADVGEILVSRTVRDLVVGSELRFDDRGTRDLAGIPEPWSVYSVSRPQ